MKVWCAQYLGHYAVEIIVVCLWWTNIDEESYKPAAANNVTNGRTSYTNKVKQLSVSSVA